MGNGIKLPKQATFAKFMEFWKYLQLKFIKLRTKTKCLTNWEFHFYICSQYN